jgi:hypothetical protein
VYAIIVLPNGGPDLEAYTFALASKSGWRQACSLFWQVARTLARAEELVEFEVCLSTCETIFSDKITASGPPLGSNSRQEYHEHGQVIFTPQI